MRPCRFLIALFLLPLFAWGQTVSIGDILCTDGSIVSREAFPTSGRTAQGLCVPEAGFSSLYHYKRVAGSVVKGEVSRIPVQRIRKKRGKPQQNVVE